MVWNLLIIREIFKGDHNAAAVRKLRRKQISALSGTLNYKEVKYWCAVGWNKVQWNRMEQTTAYLTITELEFLSRHNRLDCRATPGSAKELLVCRVKQTETHIVQGVRLPILQNSEIAWAWALCTNMSMLIHGESHYGSGVLGVRLLVFRSFKTPCIDYRLQSFAE